MTVQEQDARCGQYTDEIRIEVIDVPEPSSILTDRLRLEFNVANGNTWYEIDAIQVAGVIDKQPQKLTEVPFMNHIASLWMDASTADCTLLLNDGNLGSSISLLPNLGS